MSLAGWVTTLLAFVSGAALVKLLTTRATLRRMERLKARLVEEERARLARAKAEKEQAMSDLTIHASKIEGAGMGDLADMVNDIFGDPGE